MPEAARLDDPITHSSALSGLIAGAIIGGGLAILTVGTGGLAAVAIVGAATVAGAGVGELIGSLSFNRSVTGEIAPACSPNVRINDRPAARAHLDFVHCRNHAGHPPIAQGSVTVFINDQPAARRGDRTGCDAVISAGSPNVIIGGGRVTTDEISPEVPGYVHTAMLAVGLASAAVLAGPVAAVLGLAGGIVGGRLLGDLGGQLFGEDSDGQKIMAFIGAVVGGGIAGRAGAKGEAWFNARYEVKTVGFGANGGNIRIVPRAPKFVPARTNPTGVLNGKPGGVRATNLPNAGPGFKRGIARENQSADILARQGYRVEQGPRLSHADRLRDGIGPGKNPDYRIEGRVFDGYAPTAPTPRGVYDGVAGKVSAGQTHRVVVNLGDTPVRPGEVQGLFRQRPIPGLQEVIVIDRRGGVHRTFP